MTETVREPALHNVDAALEQRVADALHNVGNDHDPLAAVLAIVVEVRTEAYAVEREAMLLCGPEAYMNGGVHRPYWRRLARKKMQNDRQAD